MDRWIRVASLRVSASEVSTAILRAHDRADDVVVVAFHTRAGAAAQRRDRARGSGGRDNQPVGGAQLCVMQRAQALALVASITQKGRYGKGLLDVVPSGQIPVLVIGDDGVCVGVYDPRRPDGGWNEGSLP
jgi:hypothetical protein